MKDKSDMGPGWDIGPRRRRRAFGAPKRPDLNITPIAIKGQFIGSRAEKIVVWVVLVAALLTVLVVGMYWLAKLNAIGATVP